MQMLEEYLEQDLQPPNADQHNAPASMSTNDIYFNEAKACTHISCQLASPAAQDCSKGARSPAFRSLHKNVIKIF